MSEQLAQALSASSGQPTGDVMIMAPKENRVYRVPAAQAAAYEQRGFTRYSGPTIDEGSLGQSLQDWSEAGQAAGLGALNNLPFASAAIGGLAPDDVAHDYAQAVLDAKRQHPFAYGAGAVGGTVGSVALAGPLLRAAGLGASALGGAAARGLAPAAEALLPGIGEVAGEAAASGAGQVLGKIAGGAVEGAAYAGLQSTSDQLGDQAMSHALSPEGKEQLAFSFNRLAMDSAIGLGAGGALAGLGAAGSALIKGGGTFGKKLLRRSVLPEEGENILKAQSAFAGEEAAAAKETAAKVTERDARYGERNMEEDIAGDEFVPAAVKKAEELALRVQNGESAPNIVANDVHAAGTTLDDVRARAAGINVDPARLEATLNKLAPEAAASAVLKKKLQPAYDYIDAAYAKEAGKDLSEAQLQASKFDTIDLQKLFSDIRSGVNFRAPDKNKIYRAMENAGKALSSLENKHIGQVLGPNFEQTMRGAKRNFNIAAALADTMDAKNVTTIKDILKSSSASGIANAFASAIGAKSLGVGKAAAQGAAFTLVGLSPRATGFVGKRLMALDAMRQNANQNLLSVVRAGLYGVAPTFNDMRHSGDYNQWAARVIAAKAAPLENHANITQGLTEAGIPDQVAKPVALQLHGAMIDAANRLPPRQGPVDMPTMGQPDTVVQRKWMAQTRSAMDPYYALRFPTAENMRIAKQYSPQTIAKAQQLILDQAVKNPTLPAMTRYYMSRVLGRPVSSASSPRFYQMLMQLRQQDEAQAAQGSPSGSPRSSGSPSSGVASEQTQLETISQ